MMIPFDEEMRFLVQHAPVIYYSRNPSKYIRGFQIFPNTYIIGGAAPEVHRQRSVIGSHGAGILLGRLIASVQDASTVLDGCQRTPIDELGQSIRGSLTLYLLDSQANEVIVLPDPLGGGLVFTYQDSNDWAASSDLGALVSFLGLIKKPPRKSLEYVASYVATGSGGLVESSYENIRALPQFAYIVVGLDGATVRDYPVKETFFTDVRSYNESLDLLSDEVMTNVSALARAPHARRVSHLTGGVDSRVVLAAALAGGHKGDFSFFCDGGPQERDQIIAQQLASEYGLTMSEHAGIEANLAPETLEDQLLWPFEHTSGIISGPAQLGLKASSNVISSGGYGELFRSFYNKGVTFEGSAGGVAQHMFGKLAFSPDPGTRILDERFMLHVTKSLHGVIEGARNLGVREDALLDYVYLSRRNRYYVGEISRSISSFATRVDPLYSLTGASLGLRTDGLEREANVIGFDLMDRLSPGLSELPFDTDRFGGAYSRSRGPHRTRGFRSTLAPAFDGARRPRTTNAAHVRTAKPSQPDIDRAAKLRMSPRLVAQFPKIQSGLKDMVLSIPTDQLNSTFNRRAINRLMSGEPSHRAHYRTARDLYAGLLWYVNN